MNTQTTAELTAKKCVPCEGGVPKYDRDAAVGVLESYLADEEVPADGTAWARRNLAMLISARGTTAPLR